MIIGRPMPPNPHPPISRVPSIHRMPFPPLTLLPGMTIVVGVAMLGSALVAVISNYNNKEKEK